MRFEQREEEFLSSEQNFSQLLASSSASRFAIVGEPFTERL